MVFQFLPTTVIQLQLCINVYTIWLCYTYGNTILHLLIHAFQAATALEAGLTQQRMRNIK